MAMDQEFLDLLMNFTPLTLTETINTIERLEPHILTQRLGGNVVMMPNETGVYYVEDANYVKAPLGIRGDPATRVDSATKSEPHAVTPPQIFMTDKINASDILYARNAMQNPINMAKGDKDTAFDKLVAYKQRNLVKMIDRTVEWMFSQALEGEIDYKSDDGRVISHNFGLPNPVTIADTDKWTASGSDPIDLLGDLATDFKRNNQQIDPTLIIMGSNAAKAFHKNKAVKDWKKTAAYPAFYPVTDTTPLARPEAGVIGYVKGRWPLYEYSSTYEEGHDAEGKPIAVPYIDPDTVYMTNADFWRLYYGPVTNFYAGNPPLVQQKLFSRMEISKDGFAMDIHAISYPFPVIVRKNGVLRAKVV